MKAHWLDDPETAIEAGTLNDEGVLYERLDTDASRYQGALDALMARQGYTTQDEVALRPDNPKLDEICAKFVDEHYHDEDEVRFILEGEGIFDIRTRADRWMRVEVETGDLIVVPAGRHHRFFLTDSKNIRAVRLFKDASGWVPHYREAAAGA